MHLVTMKGSFMNDWFFSAISCQYVRNSYEMTAWWNVCLTPSGDAADYRNTCPLR